MEQNMHFNVGILVTITQVLLVGETRVPGENNRTTTSYRQTLSDKIVSSTPRHERDSNPQLAIGTDCTGCCKYN